LTNSASDSRASDSAGAAGQNTARMCVSRKSLVFGKGHRILFFAFDFTQFRQLTVLEFPLFDKMGQEPLELLEVRPRAVVHTPAPGIRADRLFVLA
jgi:hypothetical protein